MEEVESLELIVEDIKLLFDQVTFIFFILFSELIFLPRSCFMNMSM